VQTTFDFNTAYLPVGVPIVPKIGNVPVSQLAEESFKQVVDRAIV
jgi:hypothetical protein